MMGAGEPDLDLASSRASFQRKAMQLLETVRHRVAQCSAAPAPAPAPGAAPAAASAGGSTYDMSGFQNELDRIFQRYQLDNAAETSLLSQRSADKGEAPGRPPPGGARRDLPSVPGTPANGGWGATPTLLRSPAAPTPAAAPPAPPPQRSPPGAVAQQWALPPPAAVVRRAAAAAQQAPQQQQQQQHGGGEGGVWAGTVGPPPRSRPAAPQQGRGGPQHAPGFLPIAAACRARGQQPAPQSPHRRASRSAPPPPGAARRGAAAGRRRGAADDAAEDEAALLLQVRRASRDGRMSSAELRDLISRVHRQRAPGGGRAGGERSRSADAAAAAAAEPLLSPPRRSRSSPLQPHQEIRRPPSASSDAPRPGPQRGAPISRRSRSAPLSGAPCEVASARRPQQQQQQKQRRGPPRRGEPSGAGGWERSLRGGGAPPPQHPPPRRRPASPPPSPQRGGGARQQGRGGAQQPWRSRSAPRQRGAPASLPRGAAAEPAPGGRPPAASWRVANSVPPALQRRSSTPQPRLHPAQGNPLLRRQQGGDGQRHESPPPAAPRDEEAHLHPRSAPQERDAGMSDPVSPRRGASAPGCPAVDPPQALAWPAVRAAVSPPRPAAAVPLGSAAAPALPGVAPPPWAAWPSLSRARAALSEAHDAARSASAAFGAALPAALSCPEPSGALPAVAPAAGAGACGGAFAFPAPAEPPRQCAAAEHAASPPAAAQSLSLVVTPASPPDATAVAPPPRHILTCTVPPTSGCRLPSALRPESAATSPQPPPRRGEQPRRQALQPLPQQQQPATPPQSDGRSPLWFYPKQYQLLSSPLRGPQSPRARGERLLPPSPRGRGADDSDDSARERRTRQLIDRIRILREHMGD